MKNPPHPGRQIKDILDTCNLSITEGAKHLGVSRNSLSRTINGLTRISPEMASRLNKAFGGSAEIWIRMQAGYDLAQIPKIKNKIKVKSFITKT